ncbi:MAG: YutD-like domain-containing protein [Bacillota bacterium]
MIETEFGKFELIKDYKEAFDVKTFSERYVKYFDQYPYIVGDISADMLRLKGFNSNNENQIYDYLMESATPNAPYFILKRIK